MKSIGEPRVAHLAGAIQRNRIEKRRAVADVDQVLRLVEVHDERLVRARPADLGIDGSRFEAQFAQDTLERRHHLETHAAAAPVDPRLEQRVGVQRRHRSQRIFGAPQDGSDALERHVADLGARQPGQAFERQRW